MLSFKSLAVAAGVALCAISSAFAAPTQTITSEISSTTEISVQKTVEKRSVYVILSETKTKIEPVAVQFQYLTQVNATVEVITPLVTEVKTIISGAVVELHGLVGAPVEVILATVDGTAKVTVDVVAGLLADIILIVFRALGFVLTVVRGDILPTVIALLATVGEVVGTLLSVVLGLVGGLLGGLLVTVLGLIGEILPIILKLRVNVLISILHL